MDRLRRVVTVLALATACGTPAAGSAADAVSGQTTALKIECQGTLALPDVVQAAGARVPLTGLSGITWLGDDRYVAVMDNSATLLRLRLALSAEGAPREATALEIVTVAERHDYEDVAPRLGAPPAVFLCEEDTPAIRAFRLADGSAVGMVPLPPAFRGRRGNRGPEALALDPDGEHLWMANEEALVADGPAASPRDGTVVRIARLPLVAGRPIFAAAYRVEPSHAFVPVLAGTPLSGVVALVALGRGRLLVLERSAGPGLPPFHSRIFLVDTSRAVDVAGVEGGLSDRRDAHVGKTLLWADALGLNLEGLCLGPRLAGDRRALVGIADNGGLETPTQVAGFALSAGVTSP